MEHGLIYLILACCFGFFIAWSTGANDAANAIGTSVGSKALTLTKAIILAAIFEAAGALFAGSQVTYTIRSRIIDVSLFQQTPQLLIFGMLAVLLAVGLWLVVASYFKWPVSTTHSIVGGMVGFAVIDFGFYSVHWKEMTDIILSWVMTPFFAGIVAHLLYRSTPIFTVFNLA